MADGCAASSKIHRVERKGSIFSCFALRVLKWMSSLIVWDHGTALQRRAECCSCVILGPKNRPHLTITLILNPENLCFLKYAIRQLHSLLSSLIHLYTFTYSLLTYLDFSFFFFLISVSFLYYKLGLLLFFLISIGLLIRLVLWVKENTCLPILLICSEMLNYIWLLLER